jgi:hypothetical protein
MLDGDELPEAQHASELFGGHTQYWDGNQKLGKAIAASLGAPAWTAWDIYLYYPPGATWTGDAPPRPEAMLAQMAGVVVGSPGTLPSTGELPAKLRGRDLVVVGDQADLDALLGRVTTAFVARHPAP